MASWGEESIECYYASPVAADGKVFLANTEAKITVLKLISHGIELSATRGAVIQLIHK